MNKKIKGLLCAGLCGVLALGVAATGCQDKNKRDTEKTPLKLAIGAVDQKFNPLFYTSQNDGEIANMTQISLVTSTVDAGDEKHPYIAVGENQPTVALDYTETYYAGDTVVARGDGKDITEGDTSTADSTVYEFLIKNDIKFSDGTPLTVMDVLFNLYVYLDPAYSGSSTIYSTKIKGLQAYRQQDTSADDDSNLSMIEYLPAARERLNRLITWSADDGTDAGLKAMAGAEEDLKKVKELYMEELQTDWSSIETGWVESYKEYRFTAPWQVFYYIEGLVKNQQEINTETNTTVNKTDNEGKYLTTLDPDETTGDVEHQELINEMEAKLTDAEIKNYVNTHDNATEEYAKIAIQKEHAIKHIYESNTANSEIDYVLTYCATASTALDYFMLDEMSKDVPEGELNVSTIEGITVDHTADAEHNGTFNGKTYTDDLDILRVEIKGIDPKAKWNFGFSVAPMHYYSGSYGGVNYVEEAMNDYNSGKLYNDTATHFGVKFKDIKFMDTVLAASSKNGLPMGAGAYKCTNYGAVSGKGGTVNAQTFFYNNVAYFERNDQFTTVGSGIDNANIKFITYRVISDDKIVEALRAKEIDYGQPIATADNQKDLRGDGLEQITYLTGGYGYVGINPKYVPDIEVRRAIMHAFDISSINRYYGEGLVNIINRPISSTSWAYPENATPYYEPYTAEQIISLVKDSGNWTYNESAKKFYKRGSTEPLKLTFTIAGATTDHPSYRMFKDAEDFLEECGFEISVQTDIQALKKLSTGDLAVWAAAWSSSIDPDPYQIYSIYSNASSTKNWYKDGIMADSTDTFKTEQRIAREINELIVEGRSTLNEGNRIETYAKCFDKIMELAVEFPTYQRKDLCVYNASVLDGNTMHLTDASFNMGPLGEIWKVNFVKK
ncbi:MAG: hypothetical protein K2N14_04245 [Clostridia bacterium]|nr:hypothetical protein [Clostridia bacterium]